MNDLTLPISDAGSLLDGEPIAEAAPAARRSRQARVAWGDHVVTVGGDAPVRVQSMTNTDTVQDVTGDCEPDYRTLAKAGSELVRVTVNTDEAAEAVPKIRRARCDLLGIQCSCSWATFTTTGTCLLKKYPACARGTGEISHQPRQRKHRRRSTIDNFAHDD